MSVTRFVAAAAITLVIFVAIDAVWLTTMADRLYRPALGDMLATEFRPVTAIVFYIVYAIGLTYLAVRPGLVSGSIRVSGIHGAVLGFTAYATYDLTNQATLRNWSTVLTLSDLIWGTLLSAVAAMAGHALTRRIFPR
jgi:uncharacterized membrane protein